MDPRNPNPKNRPSMRVLTRPSTTPSPPPAPASSSDPHPAPPPLPPEGVVVVGFISRSPAASSQLINRVLDSNAFGSGHLDKPLSLDDKEELKEWFRFRKISYYHEEDKGVLFLQFCATRCPVGVPCPSSGLDTVLDAQELEELQGLLFMFSVCHVIIYIQEGSHFDTQALKKFRVLQAAKHGLAPYVRSRTTPPLPSRPHSSSSLSRPTSSAGSSPARSGGMISRNASAVSLMSGLGSRTSLFPGYFTPVILFVFVDDFSDVMDPSSGAEDAKDSSSLNQLSSLNSLAKSNLPAKGSGSVVMLARPANKSEGGFQKKLQSSLEAQMRFLIKKCRTLSSPESGQSGSRSGAVLSSAPLFSLDASRAVALLDGSTNQKSEALEFAIDLVEDVLNGKATSDSFLLESHGQSANKEDILAVKEFIYRQSDILRGRGGLVSSANSGPAGVGMVAVAAAAAAASAASGKALVTPELPTLEAWLSSSKLILNGVLTAKHRNTDDAEVGKRKPRQRNISPVKAEGVASKGVDPIDVAVSQLESGRGLNTKFSTSWCERALPTAMDVYLKDLPACYPTSQHEAHLEMALHSFRSMVRGPGVELFAKKLEDNCTSIWKSGRQQCDAVSLTGKPCMHQRHEVDNDEPVGAAAKSHSSGYFFLHACACGRSRQLRPDPFDMESANVSFNCFPDCDKFLPVVQLPDGSSAGPVQSSSWKLIRIGSANYYEPFKGLLQSGFSATQRFLSKWTISLHKPKILNSLPTKILQQGPVDMSVVDTKIDLSAETNIKENGLAQLQLGNIHTRLENQRDLSEKSPLADQKIHFGAGVPNFTMRKPFAEVVAGSSVTDSFPPLKQRKQPSVGSEKNIKQSRARDQREQSYVTGDQTSKKCGDNSSLGNIASGITSNGGMGNDPLLQIGSNVVPVSIMGSEMVKMNVFLKPAIVYVGFEHECPRGHRFLLSLDQLNELRTSHPLPESSVPSAETSDHNLADPSDSKSSSHDKIHRTVKDMVVASTNKLRNTGTSKEVLPKGNAGVNGMIKAPGLMKEPDQSSSIAQADCHHLGNIDVDLHTLDLDDGGNAFNLLNRDLPIYMKCPYCKKSKNKKDVSKIKFAGAVSQLQRIFLVTPPFPFVLATCPIIQFETSCLPESVPDREQKLQFSLKCPVVLPPESFIVLRLPFVYGVNMDARSLHPLKAFDNLPERTAWIMKGTALQVISRETSMSDRPQT